MNFDYYNFVIVVFPSGIGEQAEIQSDEQFAVVITFFMFNRTSICCDSGNSSLSLHSIL